VSEPVGQPIYRRVADALRRQIAAGELAVGSAIPSTAQLTARFGVSSTVARAAVAELRADGLVVGQPGKGVFVRATPQEVAEEAVGVEELGRRVTELRGMHEAERRQREELERAVASLRREVEELRGRVSGQESGGGPAG
jgi:GntR family transcriptional regulator